MANKGAGNQLRGPAPEINFRGLSPEINFRGPGPILPDASFRGSGNEVGF